MMAEGVVGAISDLLECAICHCRFNDAKCLRCMHTFCKGCLDRLIETADYDFEFLDDDSVQCPVCRQRTFFGARGAETLQPNLLANKIIDELKRHEELTTDEKFCKEHGAEKKFFCEKCGVVICSECALCNHGKHTFLIRNVEDASKAKVDEIVKLMSKATIWIESHEEFLSNYEEKRLQGNKRLDDIAKGIQASYRSCIELVTDRINGKKEKLMSEVESHRRDLNVAADNILVPENEAISQVSDDIECAKEMLDGNDLKKVVLGYRDWVKRLLRGIDRQIPSDMNARRRVASVESLQFHESKLPLLDVPQLGVIRQEAPENTNQDSQVSDEIECAEEMLDCTDPKEVVLKYRNWAKRLLRGIDRQIPSDVNTRRRVASVESLQFHQNKVPNTEVPQLGVIQQQTSDETDQAMCRGFLQRPRQRLLLTVRVQLSGRIKMMVPYINGSIMVRYRDGHMEVLHPDGSGGKIRAQNIAARDMVVLSDGRFVTLTKRNMVKMYGKGGENHQIEFVMRKDEIADAIARDAEDHILLLYSGIACIMRFSSEGGEPIDVIRINDIEFTEVFNTSATVTGKIMIVQPDEVLAVCSKEGVLCQRIPIQGTDRVSCDQEGKLWVISHQDIQGTNRAFLEVYAGENGERIADTYLPNDSATPGFEPWGVAASTRYFAALISPDEVGWFVCEL